MGRKPKYKIISEKTKFFGIVIKCGNCGKIVSIKTSGYDFHSSEGPCEMCGSHGDVSVDAKCPECGYLHDIELNSW